MRELLHGLPIDHGDLVEVRVPCTHRRLGKWSGFNRRGLAKITLLGVYIDGFCQQSTTYSPDFVRRLGRTS